MNSRSAIISLALLMFVYTITYVNAKPTSSQSTSQNHDLLTKLGLQKIRGPNTHHRKRLAVESRHHSRSDDSHMFVIKLPPHPHYYAFSQPEKNNLMPVSNQIPVGFKSNGKPGKIYHWNIPVIKKMVAAKKSLAVKNKHKSMKNDDLNMIDLQKPESWNEVFKIEKPTRNKPLKPSYYVPAKPKKSSFMKYFAGNGKPHSFYVIEKSKKAHYHRLLP